MNGPKERAEDYRRRAVESRRIAAQTGNSDEFRDAYMKLAQEWESLARVLEVTRQFLSRRK